MCEKQTIHRYKSTKYARYEYPEEARKKYLRTSKKHTTEEFIEICQAVYGKDRYDYSLVEYDGNKNKVKIICNNCGVMFEQKAIHHMHGHGCPVCSKGGKKKVVTGINDLQIDHIIPIKKGGKTVSSNLQVLCSKCNGRKSDKL